MPSVDEDDVYQMDVLTNRGTKRVIKLYNISVAVRRAEKFSSYSKLTFIEGSISNYL